MKPIKKVQKKVERRGNGYTELLKNLRLKSKTTLATAYRMPGSRNPRKQG